MPRFRNWLRHFKLRPFAIHMYSGPVVLNIFVLNVFEIHDILTHLPSSYRYLPHPFINHPVAPAHLVKTSRIHSQAASEMESLIQEFFGFEVM